MKALTTALALTILTLPLAALADRDRDESGHGRHGHGGHEYKQEYWDGNCKVEIKQKGNGDYKEERKCRAPRQVYAPAPVYVVPQQQPVVVAPAPVVVAPQPVYVPAPQPVYVPAPRPVEPSLTIRANIPLK